MLARLTGLALAAAALAHPGAALAAGDHRCDARLTAGQPVAGIVADSNVAEKLAIIYLSALYGAEAVTDQLPFNVSLRKEVWLVTGTVFGDDPDALLAIQICQSNGQVLTVTGK